MKNSIPIIIGIIIIAAVGYVALRPSSDETSRVGGDEALPSVSPDLITFGDTSSTTAPATSVSPVASPESGDAMSEERVESVSVTDTGFEPATLTVPSGTTVVFTNNGQAAHQPASDPHPAHTGLPGFDAKRGLATGETYSFTFTKTGTFGYHDHLRFQSKGTIVVQ